MGQEKVELLEKALDLKQRELDLVLAIDHIRDTAADPRAMLTGIVNVLTDLLRVDFCAVALIDQETQRVELKAIKDKAQPQINISRKLAERAAQLDEITVWNGDNLPAIGMSETVHIAGVPIVMGKDERLGALLLARTKSGFDSGDIKLLQTTESMVDSAVIQGYTDYELKQHLKELEAIYQIDHIRDQGLAFDEMLNLVLLEVCRAIEAEVGFTMLYDQTGQRLELRATTSQDLFQVTGHYQFIEQRANEALQQAQIICRNDLDSEVRSLLCLPLILKEELIGVLGVINHRRRRGFSADDRQLLSAIGSQIDTAIFESIEQRRLRQVLGRSVDPRVMARLLANPNVSFLTGERMVVSVLYADLRGSTQLAEQTDPERLVGFINDYLGRMTQVILADEGTLDKFVGDEVMALFGAPFPQADHALRAIRVGLTMQAAHKEVMQAWRERGIEPAPVGVGIATGELIVGEMGSSQRTDFTVIGKAANLGARICSAAKAGEVLVCPETYRLVADQVEATPLTGLQFKGVDREVVVYRIDHILMSLFGE